MFWLCRTCGVEHDATPEVCTICADERQWVPAEGQQWATLEELAAEGVRSTVAVLEPGLIALGSTPPLGIGQLGKLVCTAGGNVLWDPSGFLDDAAVAAVTEHGPVVGLSRAIRTCSAPRSSGAAASVGCRCTSTPPTRTG